MEIETVTREELAPILRELVSELEQTVDLYASRERFDAPDAAEAALSIAIKVAAALIPSGSAIGPVLQLLGGPISDAITSLVERAATSSRTPQALRERIAAATQTQQEVEARASELEATPRREFAERFRVWRLRRRAEELQGKIDRLQQMLVAAQDSAEP